MRSNLYIYSADNICYSVENGFELIHKKEDELFLNKNDAKEYLKKHLKRNMLAEYQELHCKLNDFIQATKALSHQENINKAKIMAQDFLNNLVGIENDFMKEINNEDNNSR